MVMLHRRCLLQWFATVLRSTSKQKIGSAAPVPAESSGLMLPVVGFMSVPTAVCVWRSPTGPAMGIEIEAALSVIFVMLALKLAPVRLAHILCIVTIYDTWLCKKFLRVDE